MAANPQVSTIPVDLGALLQRQRAEFLRVGPPSIAQRRAALKRLKQILLAHRQDFVAAINADFGSRSRQETELLELAPMVSGIDYLHGNLRRLMRTQRRRVSLQFAPASARVVYQPLGVIGIISPWNYPVYLAAMPLATALAAGNRVMLKPSETTPATSSLMARVFAEAFTTDEVAVVTGDAAVGAAFAALPFDHLLFTGSTAIGRSVMRAASANLVPVTLELGGKSPAIIECGSSLQRAARSIAFGKLANAGQTCIAPDYVLVAQDEVADFVSAYVAEVQKLYPDLDSGAGYTTIVSEQHYARLRGLLDDARAKGARIIEVGSNAPGSRTTELRHFAPTVVVDVADGMSVLKEEIFGPILPVVPYGSLDDAIAYVNARSRPLALYFFGSDGAGRRRVLEGTTSGGVSINETLLHCGQDDLPFGGVGASGMGAYHGEEGFRAFSHAKAVFEQSRLNFTDLIRPPYGKRLDRIVNFLLR